MTTSTLDRELAASRRLISETRAELEKARERVNVLESILDEQRRFQIAHLSDKPQGGWTLK